jgi:Alpha/beta hydrolase
MSIAQVLGNPGTLVSPSSDCVVSAVPGDLDRLGAAVKDWSERAAQWAGRLSMHSAQLGLQGLADEARTVSAAHAQLVSELRLTASKFRSADTATQQYNARVGAVGSAIAAWLPTNRDATRAKVASDGAGHFLTFDPRHDGRAVEVFGDLTYADHIVVLVPGMDNDISGFSGIRKRSIDLKAEMEKVAEPGESVSVVMWLGYDTPDYSVLRTIPEGGGSAKAKAGAKTLDADVDFLRQVNPFAHFTVIGHSYGTVVLGQALKRGLNADDAIAVASPGMDARDRSELGSPEVKLWATRFLFHKGHPTDLIPLAPVHGEDPADSGFHAARFRSGGVRNHSDYFRPGTEALHNLALIATGKKPTA